MTAPPPNARLAYAGDPETLAQTIYELIQLARESIVLQMYLLASDGHTVTLRPVAGSFPYAQRVTDWLLEKRRRAPDVDIVVLLDTNTPEDPRLTRRPGDFVRHQLERAGIPVLNANLFHTRFNRARRFPPFLAFHERWPGSPREGWVARQNRWQTWHNVEDHRKNLVIDRGRWAAVTSHNFIDLASAWHENLFLFDGEPGRALWGSAAGALRLALELPQRLDPGQRSRIERLLEGEATDAIPYQRMPRADGLEPLMPSPPPFRSSLELRPASIQVLSNEQIRPRIEARLAGLEAGDEVLIASAYFSDLRMLEALRAAAGRGVRVRILIDDVAALPLDPLLRFLIRHLVNRRFVEQARMQIGPGLEVRVHPSAKGDMMHLKTAAFLGRRRVLIGGQANYTPNSFNGAWWETDLEIEGEGAVGEFVRHFEALWALPENRLLVRPGPLSGIWSLVCRGLLYGFAKLGVEP